jgi:hypothetical protein
VHILHLPCSDLFIRASLVLICDDLHPFLSILCSPFLNPQPSVETRER